MKHKNRVQWIGIYILFPLCILFIQSSILFASELSGNHCIDGVETGQIVDILLGYTAEAEELIISQGVYETMDEYLDSQVAVMNEVNQNSDVDLLFRLADTIRVSFDEAEVNNNASDILPLLSLAQGESYNNSSGSPFTDPEGKLDELLVRKEQVSADVVGLYIGTAAQGTPCGLAHRPYDSSPIGLSSFKLYFAVGAIRYAQVGWKCSENTMAHEIGHTFGNHHDKLTAQDEIVIYPYSYGYLNTDQEFRTLMAYTCPAKSGGTCESIKYWSNPDIMYQGYPLGIVGETNNAQTMRNTQKHLANVRANCYEAPIVINEIEASGEQGGSDFIEIKNVSSEPVDMDDYELTLYDGRSNGSTTPTSKETIRLQNITLQPDEYYVICGRSGVVDNCTHALQRNDFIQDINSVFRLTPYQDDFTVDAVTLGNEWEYPYTENNSAVNDETDFTDIIIGVSRKNDGVDTNQNDVDFERKCITPGRHNNTAPTGDNCRSQIVINLENGVIPNDDIQIGDEILYRHNFLNNAPEQTSVSMYYDFSSALTIADNAKCTITTVQDGYNPNLIEELTTIEFSETACKDAKGNITNLFDTTDNASTNTSPIRCEGSTTANGIVTSVDRIVGWGAELCDTGECSIKDLGLVNLFDSNNTRYGTIPNRDSIPALQNAPPILFPRIDIFDEPLAQGTWVLEVSDDSSTNNGLTLALGENQSRLVLNGHPYMTYTTTQQVDPNKAILIDLPVDSKVTIECISQVNEVACLAPSNPIISDIYINNTPYDAKMTLSSSACNNIIPPTRTPVPTPTPEVDPFQQTVNCDNRWNLLDIVFINQFNALLMQSIESCDPNEPRGLYLPACDINDDNVCGLLDAVISQQCNALMNNPFCAKLR